LASERRTPVTRYIAFDVHAESTTCVVLSSAGKRLKEEVVETSASALISFLKTIPGRKQLVIEEGTQSAWLHETLSPFVDEFVVAIVDESNGAKNDSRDSWRLAEQLRIGAIQRTVFKRPQELAALRAAVKAHRLLTSDVVRVKNRLRALFRSRGVAVTEEVYQPNARSVKLACLSQHVRYQAEMLGKQLDLLEPLRDEARGRLREEAKEVPSVERVATLPGFGVIRAATLVAATITPNRFRTTRQFWSYSGLALVTRSSSDWVRHEHGWKRAAVNQTRGLNRNRHPWLKDVFKAAATTVAAMPNHPLHADYQRLLQQGTKPNRAKLTIARRLASAALAVWRKQEAYEPNKHKSLIATP